MTDYRFDDMQTDDQQTPVVENEDQTKESPVMGETPAEAPKTEETPGEAPAENEAM